MHASSVKDKLDQQTGLFAVVFAAATWLSPEVDEIPSSHLCFN